MIQLLRLDERMIHGQVAIKWSRHIDINRIVVANDYAAHDHIVQKSLMMAAPSTCKVAIKTVEESIKLLNDPRASELKVLLIANNPDDTLKLIESVPGIPKVNIGNYGRVASRRGDELRHTYAANLYAYPDEAETFKKIYELSKEKGITEIVYQTTPENVPEDLKKLMGF